MFQTAFIFSTKKPTSSALNTCILMPNKPRFLIGFRCNITKTQTAPVPCRFIPIQKSKLTRRRAAGSADIVECKKKLHKTAFCNGVGWVAKPNVSYGLWACWVFNPTYPLKRFRRPFLYDYQYSIFQTPCPLKFLQNCKRRCLGRAECFGCGHHARGHLLHAHRALLLQKAEAVEKLQGAHAPDFARARIGAD